MLDYSTYLFDFDYTLADTEAPILACYRHVLESNGFFGVTDDAIRRTIGLPVADSFALLCGMTEQERLHRYRAEFVRKADEIMVQNTLLYPSVIPVLTKLKERGCHTGIVSTKHRYRIMDTLRKFSIAGLIDIVIGMEDVKEPKPDPEGVLKAVGLLGVKKSDILYTGDSLIDANTAKNAGVSFAAVTTGVTAAEEFKALPYKRIMSDLLMLIL
jgi:phosphoglycolate phosphatase